MVPSGRKLGYWGAALKGSVELFPFLSPSFHDFHEISSLFLSYISILSHQNWPPSNGSDSLWTKTFFYLQVDCIMYSIIVMESWLLNTSPSTWLGFLHFLLYGYLFGFPSLCLEGSDFATVHHCILPPDQAQAWRGCSITIHPTVGQ